MERILELMNAHCAKEIKLTHHLVDVSAVAEDDDSAVVNTIVIDQSGTLLCYDDRDENEDGTYTPLWIVKNLPQSIIDELLWSAKQEF